MLSCSQSIENAQVFIATNDLQIGSNRFTFAVADKNGLVNSESIEVSFNGDGGYPKIIKSFNFVQFPDYYNTELGNGVFTQIIEFEKAGIWCVNFSDKYFAFPGSTVKSNMATYMNMEFMKAGQDFKGIFSISEGSSYSTEPAVLRRGGAGFVVERQGKLIFPN